MGHPQERALANASVLQVYGEIVSITDGSFRVRTAAGPVDARRAHSCLVAPIVGDHVLVSVPEAPASAPDAPRAIAPRGYVLAVLERASGAPTTVVVEGDLALSAQGRVSVTSPVGVELASPARVDVRAGELSVDASAARFVLGGLSVLASKLKAHLGESSVVGGAIDSVFQRVSQSMKSSFRVVEGTDRLEARDASWTATETLSVRATNTIVTSEQLVKLDGDQIHLG